MAHMKEYNLLAEIVACPVCSTDLSTDNADTQVRCSGCSTTFTRGNFLWDFVPADIDWSSPMWETWQQVQANGLVSYQSDREHNLAVGEREDCQRFASFCNCSGLVLDAGCGPQPWPSYFRRAQGITYVGIDPLLQDVPAEFLKLRALAEFLPFRVNMFDHILFATSLDHLVDPITALRAAVKVCKPDGEINVWLGEKSADAPEPADSPEWYRRLRKPDLAEDLFHIKRLSGKAFTDFAMAAGLTLVQIEVHTVDDYRTNYFYRLKISN